LYVRRILGAEQELLRIRLPVGHGRRALDAAREVVDVGHEIDLPGQ
jgi:hypothetical protein